MLDEHFSYTCVMFTVHSSFLQQIGDLDKLKLHLQKFSLCTHVDMLFSVCVHFSHELWSKL
jgi:hypothetical protein